MLQQPDPTWTVTLRDERTGRDQRVLTAQWIDGVGLRFDGQDLGPGTRTMTDDGEYEWTYVVDADSVPLLLQRLGEPPDADLRTVLTRWTGARAHELEHHTTGLRTSFSAYP